MYTLFYHAFWQEEVLHGQPLSASATGQIVLEFHRGRSIRALANDYEPCEATIRQWIERETGGARLDESAADELKRLRKENQQLREDKLILEKAAAWFATHRNER